MSEGFGVESAKGIFGAKGVILLKNIVRVQPTLCTVDREGAKAGSSARYYSKIPFFKHTNYVKTHIFF
jgi:hypothetical protein